MKRLASIHPRLRWEFIGLLLGVSAFACEANVAGGLDSADANEAIASLQQRGISARKQPDPDAEGRFRLSVAQADGSNALSELQQAGLPRRRSPGLLEALGEGSIIPSRAAEHARLLAGTAGDLERSLAAIDGVLAARVHLAVPLVDPLSTQGSATPRATASVLLSHNAKPGLRVEEIQRLIAGAVPGLAPEAVSVALQPVQRPAYSPPELTRVGPVTVTRASAATLKTILTTALALNLVLLVSTFWLWRRSKRLRLIGSPQADAALPTLPTAG